MVRLDHRDLQRLVEILQRFQEFKDEKSRRDFLPLVGLEPLLPRMDLAGSPLIASVRTINFLADYGRLSNEMEALGSLLEGIRVYLGIAEQNVVDEILTKYQLISPFAQKDRPVARFVQARSLKDSQGSSLERVAPATMQPSKILISYSREDQRWLERLKTQLALLERQHIIEVWDDTRIVPGQNREEVMNRVLNVASAALLLISPNFLASKMIMEQELPRILSRHAQGQMVVFPLILSPCLYQESPLQAFATFNSIDQPLSKLTPVQVDAVLVKLVRELQRSIESFIQRQASSNRDASA